MGRPNKSVIIQILFVTMAMEFPSQRRIASVIIRTDLNGVKNRNNNGTPGIDGDAGRHDLRFAYWETLSKDSRFS